jgi:hypothetical protein
MAILKLDSLPPTIETYELFRGSSNDVLGKTVDLIGYGASGEGHNGQDPAFPIGKRRAVQNVFDQIGGFPLDITYFLADFDSGSSSDDHMGNLGLGSTEGCPATSDSGGPAL